MKNQKLTFNYKASELDAIFHGIAEHSRNIAELNAEPTTGGKIRIARKQTGKSAEWLAKQIGCSQSTISQYERGVRCPAPKVLNAIAAALHVPQYQLYAQDYLEEYKPEAAYSSDDDSAYAAYLRDYNITQDEYIRFSISYEKLSAEARAKVMEYLEILVRIPEYTDEP